MRISFLAFCVATVLLTALSSDGQQSPSKDQPAVTVKERELAKLVRAIEAKEKDLEALRGKADALRREIITLKQKADGGAGVFTSPEQMVAGLPENARPRNSNDTIRLNRANDWLEANVFGKSMQWDYFVGAPMLQRVAKSKDYVIAWGVMTKLNRHKLHGSDWLVRINTDHSRLGPSEDGIQVLVDEATAERLEGVSKKAVKLSAKIKGAAFSNYRPYGDVLFVKVSDVIIDGIKTLPVPFLKGKGKGGFGKGGIGPPSPPQ